jgi:hypothetical protein
MSKHSIEDTLGCIENEAVLVQNAITTSMVTGSVSATEHDSNGNRYTVRRIGRKTYRVVDATELTLLGMVFVRAAYAG